jgi:hypothetical protein
LHHWLLRPGAEMTEKPIAMDQDLVKALALALARLLRLP